MAVEPFFTEFTQIRRESDTKALWSYQTEVPEGFYWKALDAIEAELLRPTAAGAPRASKVSKNITSYFIDNHDSTK